MKIWPLTLIATTDKKISAPYHLGRKNILDGVCVGDITGSSSTHECPVLTGYIIAVARLEPLGRQNVPFKYNQIPGEMAVRY